MCDIKTDLKQQIFFPFSLSLALCSPISFHIEPKALHYKTPPLASDLNQPRKCKKDVLLTAHPAISPKIMQLLVTIRDPLFFAIRVGLCSSSDQWFSVCVFARLCAFRSDCNVFSMCSAIIDLITKSFSKMQVNIRILWTLSESVIRCNWMFMLICQFSYSLKM